MNWVEQRRDGGTSEAPGAAAPTRGLRLPRDCLVEGYPSLAVERELGFAPVDMAGRLGYLKRKIGKQ